MAIAILEAEILPCKKTANGKKKVDKPCKPLRITTVVFFRAACWTG